MFSSLTPFLWFFIPTLILIVFGIVYEEKLVAIERAVIKTVYEIRAEKRYQKAIRVAYQGYTAEQKASQIHF